jgi:hypothetical protein
MANGRNEWLFRELRGEIVVGLSFSVPPKKWILVLSVSKCLKPLALDLMARRRLLNRSLVALLITCRNQVRMLASRDFSVRATFCIDSLRERMEHA